MESQDILKLETGTKETTNLKPAIVKIVNVSIRDVGEKGNKKISCSVKHPDKEETIEISEVKFEKNKKLQEVGLWVNLDEDGKIRKGSALAVLLSFLEVQTPEELKDKEVKTVEDERGFLCFKAY